MDTVIDHPAAAAAPATERPAPPRIGQMWPGEGGVYAGLMRGENGQPDYHLIVPTDPLGQHDGIAWGGFGMEAPGPASSFDGLANTTALAGAGDAYPAAQWATGIAIDGHTDWYLPSRRELRLCWVNVPEQFESGWYWTSTQCSRHYAWIQNFGDGLQLSNGKDGQARARAVRRLIA
jgi:hypothetical protein